jgi:hypothetical protein
MKKKINYTGRKKIKKQDFAVTINRKDTVAVDFNVSFKLKDYAFPDNAKVFVEAFRHNELKRFDFGTVQDIKKIDTDISELSRKDTLLFNLKIVDDQNDKGKIIGYIKSVKPIDEGYDRSSILDVEFCEFSDNLIWKIAYDEGGPILQINTKITNIQYLITDHPFFFFNVYPAVIKEIMYQIKYIDNAEIEDNEYEWHDSWIKMAEKYSNRKYNKNIDSDDYDSFIEEFVAGFANKHNALWKKLISEYGGDD